MHYIEFMSTKGKTIPKVSGDIKSRAFLVDDSLEAIELLEKERSLILGGEILTSDENNDLRYAIHEWGPEYVYLNWSIPSKEDHPDVNYLELGYSLARKSTQEARIAATRLGRDCYIWLITEVS